MTCNLDSDGCTGGLDEDTGEPGPCPACVAELRAETAYWRRQWDAASPEERDPERYAADMREGGRGHLLRGDR
jgi:hypothetical protein